MSDWWKGALIYQIYPRSYKDSTGDGIGDLRGISTKLDYIASLGVDAIWISPFFKSPMADFGYDISNYQEVDPIFGSLDDFRTLLDTAHGLGLKVIIDQVLSHSSDQHPWFIESRSSKNNPKADWYVWADPKEDGSEPNNWLAFFGGSAWEFDKTREQYYLHNFLTSQPDLNFHNPEVRQAQLDNLRFWLDLGVDGFRLDVANFYFHSAGLEDNPILAEDLKTTVGVADINPYSQQQHIYDISQPENLVFLTELRQLLDSYPDRTSMGEINAEDALGLMASYTSGGDKLHMAYTFDLLGSESSVQHIQDVVARLESGIDQGWPCWALGNHDVTRVATRWGANEDATQFSLVAMAMLISLQGSVCIYQGEELGLPEADVAFEDIVDPYGKPFWPQYKGRDGCRTPMVWSSETNGGFSTGKPWLPIDNAHLPLAATVQEQSKTSLLNAMRRLITWRQSIPALVKGSMTNLATDNMLCWIREDGDQKVLAAFNLSSSRQHATVNAELLEPLKGHGFEGTMVGNTIELAPYQAMFAIIK